MADWIGVDVISVNQEIYDAAQEQLAAGTWRLDPARGLLRTDRDEVAGSLNTCGYLRLRFRVNGKRISALAHRVMWEAMRGPIPAGRYVNHVDGDKTNNSIENLELVTPKQNMAHAHATGLLVARGPRGSRAPSAKLTESQVGSIKVRLRMGESPGAISREFGVEKSTISRIKNGSGWRHVA